MNEQNILIYFDLKLPRKPLQRHTFIVKINPFKKSSDVPGLTFRLLS